MESICWALQLAGEDDGSKVVDSLGYERAVSEFECDPGAWCDLYYLTNNDKQVLLVSTGRFKYESVV